jgi:aminopeptidase N
MENAGCVTFNESYLFRSKVTDAARERRAGTILHEMAHMWFGDLVTMRWWDDLWLNESFADFAAVLAQARATRFTNTWITFANSEKLWAYQQDQLPSTHPIVADVPDTRSIHVNFDGITYAKGAAVLRQLVAWVGEEPFLDGVRRYFRRHEFGNTDLGDFLVALEETSGRDLRAWSKEWLETAGLNTLRPAFETTTRNGKDVFSSFIIAQEAPAEWPVLRPHRVTVGLYVASNRWLERRRGVEIDVVGGGTQVDDLVGEPVPDLVLVNDEDLAYAKIRLDPRSLRTLTQRLRDLRDPLPRAIAWAACWDMVRDAEMPTREYLPVVLGHVGAEEDIGVVQRQLSQLRRAIDLYGDPANREAARQSLAEAAHRQMFEAAPGSDHQLAWARTFIAAAGSEEHVSLVRGLLDGTTQFEGLEVDTDLRWHIVVCLAAGGAADEDVIVAELERDPTDAGRRHAATARAARPTPEAKALAWDAVIGDVSLPPATVNAIIRGFQQAGQPTLLEPYAPKYFSAVKPTWATRDLEMALAFTAGVYPRLVIGQEVVDMTDDYLATESPPRPARRLILEGRDDVLRSMRARARDAERE